MTTLSTRDATAPTEPLLTMCTEPGCGEPAVFSFLWPWGEQGACCSLHRTHVQQKSDSLDRGPVNFTALDPNRRPPLTRDERTQLIAAKMSAELDAQEAKARGGELYHENTQLADEVRRLRARQNELEAQVKDRQGDIKTLTIERDRARADAHDAALETKRLLPLVPKAYAPAAPAATPPAVPPPVR